MELIHYCQGGCGRITECVYCEKCAEKQKCLHGNKVGDCNDCDVEGDLAYDAERGR
tara:strand:- start:874 stop:1041 length:168 start_codon:yes stop_codon:yes gene_type:complete